MYFPFLRGKRNELDAIVEMSELIKSNSNVIPIIEPVNTNSYTVNTLKKLDSNSIPFLLIINPFEGDLKGEVDTIEDDLVSKLHNHKTSRLLFVISKNTKIETVKGIIHKYDKFKISFLHIANSNIAEELYQLSKSTEKIEYHIFTSENTSESYQNIFEDFSRVIIEDGFNSVTRNSDFPEDEIFSDLFIRYSSKYEGFGDYLIVGKKAPTTGGPAHAVALHYTHHSKKDNAIIIRHFLSDDIEGTHDVQGKYFQALRKMCKYFDDYRKSPYTRGENGFKENYKEKVYHGLGYPKKLSIMHHIELLSNLL